MKIDVKKLKILMAQNDIKDIKQLAEKTGLAYANLTLIASGKKAAKASTLATIARTLGTTIKEIISEEI